MRLAVLGGKARKGEVELPRQFAEPVREDLIRRAVHALQANARQPYGADPEAGKRASAELSRRRRKYRGSYGAGISRVPRKILSRRGTRMYWVGAFAPGTVGGRRAHPPKAEKVWDQKVNKRENRKAIRSALAATVDKALVSARGHRIPDGYPFLIDTSLEALAKTGEVKKALLGLGFQDEFVRAGTTRVRAGKGTMRGRKTKRPVSILIVTAGADAALRKAAANLAGISVVSAEELNAELLAPGGHPGRATLYTEAAIERMAQEGLFLDGGKKPQAGKAAGTDRKQEAKKPAPKKAAKPEAAAKDAPAKPAPRPTPGAKAAPEGEAV